MAILGTIALGFSLYAGYWKLAWWMAAGVGFTIAAVVSLTRVAESPLRDRLARGDANAAWTIFYAALLSGLGGAAFHTAAYLVMRLLFG